MKQIAGSFIISLSLLTLSINIMLGQIAYHIDRLDANFSTNFIDIFPNSVFWLLFFSTLIGLFLIFSDKLFKKNKEK